MRKTNGIFVVSLIFEKLDIFCIHLLKNVHNNANIKQILGSKC